LKNLTSLKKDFQNLDSGNENSKKWWANAFTKINKSAAASKKPLNGKSEDALIDKRRKSVEEKQLSQASDQIQ
jgi:hypothetical protein